MAEPGKYLAIKNWDVYQKRMGKRDFIRDSTNKDSDPDYSKLSAFCRYLLDGLQRLRGLHGRNPENDATWIARALLMVRTDRPHVPHAVRTLIAHGFLIPTDQQHDSIEEIRNKTRVYETKTENSQVVVTVQTPPVEKPPEVDGETEFRKLLSVHPKPEDDHATMNAFHTRVIRDAHEAKVPEAEVLSRIHEAAALYRRMTDEGLIDFVYPLGAWLRKGICNQNPERWKGKSGNGKKSLLSFD